MFRALFELSRISNLPTVWTNVLAAWILAHPSMGNTSDDRGWLPSAAFWTPALGWTLLGASLVYSAGMLLNDACDAVWDRDNRPERPIPSGRISLGQVWGIGITWLVGGAALMIFLGGTSWLYTTLLLLAIIAYDVYHKPWAGSVIVMGACRTLLYLAAGSAVGLSRLVLDYGVLLGVYVVALTLVARAEGRGKATVLTRVLAVAFLLLPPLFQGFTQYSFCKGPQGLPAWTSAPIYLSCAWTLFALTKMWRGGKHIGDAVGLLLAGIVIVDGMAISQFAPLPALAFCALAPLLRLWQRWVAAT